MDLGLVVAAKSGDVDYLLRLIGEETYDEKWFGDTPLHLASMRGHLAFVQEMLKWKKETAYRLNPDGFTPLHLASANGHLQIVSELLKVDPALCTIKGRECSLPLHFAVAKGRLDVMKTLLSASPDSFEKKTCRGETVFHLSVTNGHIGAFELLMQRVQKFKKEQILNEKNDNGNTVLHDAVLRKQDQVIHTLVDDHVAKLHVDVNSKNKLGLTPLDLLYRVMGDGDCDLELALLKAGAKRGKDVPPRLRPPPPRPNIANQVPNIPVPTKQESRSMKNNNNNKRVQSDSELRPLLGGMRQDNNYYAIWRATGRNRQTILIIAIVFILYLRVLFVALSS